MRGVLAGALVLTLALIVAGSFWALASRALTITDLDALLRMVFGPIVALVGAATGFYYGGVSESKRR
jgi:hypothetical protein